MEIPSIVFILLFILVGILILLHTSNKKYAEKISILEQTLDMKADAITSLKRTYAEAKKAIANDNTQKNNLALQKQSILTLNADKLTMQTRIEALNKEIKEQQKTEATMRKEHTQAIEMMHQEAKEYERQIYTLQGTHEKKLLEEQNRQHSLRADIEKRDMKIFDLKATLQKEKQQREEDHALRMLEVAQYKKKIQSDEDAIGRYEEKICVKDRKIQQVKDYYKNKLAQIKDEMHAKEKNVDIKSLLVESLEKQYREKLEHHRLELTRLEGTIAEQEITIETLEERYREDTSTNQTVIEKQKEVISALTTQNSRAEERSTRLQERYSELNERYTSLDKSYQELKYNAQQSKEKLENSIKLMNDKMYAQQRKSAEISILYEKEKEALLIARQERKHIDEMYDEYKSISQQRSKDFEKELESKERLLDELKEAYNTLEAKAITLEKENSEVVEHNRVLKRTYDETLLSFQALEQNLQEQEAQQAQDRSAFEEVLREHKRVAAEQYHQYETEIKEQEKYRKSVEEQKNNKITLLRKSLETKDIVISQAIDKATLQEQKSQKAFKILEEKLTQLESLHEDMQVAFAVERKEREGAYQNLLKQYEAQKKQVDTLQRSYTSVKKDEEHRKLPIETKVLHALEEGLSSTSIAKTFHIPKKRVELIMKLNHIQSKHKDVNR